MRHTPILLNLLFVVYTAGATDVKSKVVTIDQGPVRGYKSAQGNFYEFHGIPYATTPTGRGKFKPPLPPPVWTEPFEAVRQNIICPQALILPVLKIDEEDCLLINVFVPDVEETNLPVVVYVHGGGYKGGAGNFLNPYVILERGNFIAVNFNYRVSVQGFLCLGTEDIPGNAGMKDQVAALCWVKRNIHKFGGNPDNISISGHSAGSSAVELLLLSETTAGLFHRISSESGAGVGLWSVQLDPLEYAKRLARHHNFTEVDDIYALEEFFKTASFEQLNTDLFGKDRNSTFGITPCLERDTVKDAFLSEAPVDIMKKGKFRKMPMLMGFANMEGLLRSELFHQWKDEMNEDFVKFLPADLKFESKEEKEEVAKRIKMFYFGTKAVSKETVTKYINYFGDIMFNYPTLRSVKYQIEAGNKDVYLYEYSYAHKYNIETLQTNMPDVDGATHDAQTLMLLDVVLGLSDFDGQDTDSYKQMNALMKNLWINFFHTGKPVPEVTTKFPQGWPPVSTPNGSPYVDLNLQPKLHNSPLLGERVRFWDEIYDKYYQAPIPPPELPPKHSEF